MTYCTFTWTSIHTLIFCCIFTMHATADVTLTAHIVSIEPFSLRHQCPCTWTWEQNVFNVFNDWLWNLFILLLYFPCSMNTMIAYQNGGGARKDYLFLPPITTCWVKAAKWRPASSLAEKLVLIGKSRNWDQSSWGVLQWPKFHDSPQAVRSIWNQGRWSNPVAAAPQRHPATRIRKYWNTFNISFRIGHWMWWWYVCPL